MSAKTKKSSEWKKVVNLSFEAKTTASMLDLFSFSEALRPLNLAAKLPLLFNLLQSFLCLSHSAGVRPLSRYCGRSERTFFPLIAPVSKLVL
jgi:hypothetical protein